MHMQGTPATMQIDPRYDDVVGEVQAFFEQRAKELANAGVYVSQMVIDPGFGFGKTVDHNLTLLRNIGQFVGCRPLMVGASRKGFLRKLLHLDSAAGTSMTDSTLVAANLATTLHCALAGVDIIRTHDVMTSVRLIGTLPPLRATSRPL